MSHKGFQGSMIAWRLRQELKFRQTGEECDMKNNVRSQKHNTKENKKDNMKIKTR